MEGKTTISTAQMVTFLEAGCVQETTPLHAYLQWHPARARHSGTWYLVNCQGRAGQGSPGPLCDSHPVVLETQERSRLSLQTS